MQQFNLTTQEQIEAFRRRVISREHFYREAIAALAVDSMMQQFRGAPQPPRRRRLLCAPIRVLVGLVRWLFSLVLRKRGESSKTQPASTSDTEPIVIDIAVIDVCPRPPYHCKTDASPRYWLLIGSSDEERSISDE